MSVTVEIFLAAFVLAQGEAALPAATLDPHQLVEEVLDRNPELEGARLALRAARDRAHGAGLLPAPMVAAGIAPGSFGTGVRVGHQLEVRQTLPWAERRRAERRGADVEAMELEAELATLRLDLALETTMLLIEGYRVDRAHEVNAEQLTLLAELQKASAARYAAGLAGQAEPLAAEVEHAELLHREVELEAESRVIQARLNTLLHRRPREPLAAFPSRLEPLDRGLPEEEPLVLLALTHRPELAGAGAGIGAAEVEIELARLERRPELEAMASYNSMWDDREHRVMVGLAASVPWQRQRRLDASRHAEAHRDAAVAARVALESRIRLELEEIRAGLEEALHRITVIEDRLLPAARDALRAAVAGYRSSTSELMAVFEAARAVRRAELERQEALAAHAEGRARLLRAVGLRAGIDELPVAVAGGER